MSSASHAGPERQTAHAATTAGGSAPLDALAADIALLEAGTGVFVREGCGVILLRGEQAAEFLSGITTNHVKALPVGALQHHLICANKGKILFDVSLIRTKPEEYLLLTAPGELQAVAGHLDFYHVRESFEMGQVGFARVDLIGRGVAELLRERGIAEQSPVGRFAEGPLVTASDPMGTLPRVAALLPAVNEASFMESLIAVGTGARRIGADAYEEARIWAGIPLAGLDFTSDFLPAEAALYTHLSFNKGCYVGQEIHARMHHRGHPNRKLVAVDMPESGALSLTRDSELFHNGEVAGRVTSLARLPREGRRRAIALVRFATVQAKAALCVTPDGQAIVNQYPLSTDLGGARA